MMPNGVLIQEVAEKGDVLSDNGFRVVKSNGLTSAKQELGLLGSPPLMAHPPNIVIVSNSVGGVFDIGVFIGMIKVVNLPIPIGNGKEVIIKFICVFILMECWRNDTNVILADEMGLGKIVQFVSMLGFLQEFSTKNKLLITSTQLQNSVEELW
ncbi:hypothetical protein IFM89_019419 [Coptis chinensis]|uniref:SNF2 N-terminal domain-containing protein n=1 Tax=Coptis chinensis TaxID=261450 RepID=A0A835IR02_9MAGN|nr:hypothetical protein IFM89_019419 [Coptis chinensis]